MDASRITCATSPERVQLVVVRPAGGEPLQRLLLADRADAARHALPARLVAEELGDAQQRGHELRLVVVDDHDARAERDARGARVLVRELQVELVRADERAGGAAEQHRLHGPGAREVEQLAQRRAERQLVEPRPLDAAGEAEEARARRAFRAGLRVLGAADAEHLEHVEERLDVVHRGRLAEQPDLDRERRLVARLAALALDRLEQRRLLAAHVRARTDAQLDLEAVAVRRRRVDRVLHAHVRERVLGADVDVALLRARREAGDRERLDERERVALHQHAVLERPGSDSSALQTTYRVCSAWSRTARHFVPVGNAAPPRPSSFDSVTSAITASGPSSRARASASNPPAATYASSDVGIDAVGDAAQEPQALARCGSGGDSAGSCSSNGASPATVRYFAGARSQSPRHGLGCSPAPTVAPFNAHERSVQACVTSAGRSSSASSA